MNVSIQFFKKPTNFLKSISGTQKSFNPHFTIIVGYKIDQISKTKKNSRTKKFASEH